MKKHQIHLRNYSLKPRNSTESYSQTLSSKALTSRKQPPIRLSNPEVQTLNLGFFKKQSINHNQSETIKQLRDQGEHRPGLRSLDRYIKPGGSLGRDIYSPAVGSIPLG
ncbi:hypothetical protein RHMOL_Rhmol10G0204100 [Rhododendron molle]|uniref:Uncharacterized protein n=1 Tax=Rhododendron molle TaxID=49168 RepID=A0ACC0M4L8_RHOML|nr:hypothetical protein RHMOL_Rhmol10G0204100 [Rhododendron molle]